MEHSDENIPLLTLWMGKQSRDCFSLSQIQELQSRRDLALSVYSHWFGAWSHPMFTPPPRGPGQTPFSPVVYLFICQALGVVPPGA